MSFLRPISLVSALAVLAAAVAALFTILAGDLFHGRDTEILLIAAGFAIFSGTASAGMWGLWKEPVTVQWLGLATLVLAMVSFGLAVWAIVGHGDEIVAQWAGCCTLGTLALTHLTLSSGAMTGHDSTLVTVVTLLSMLVALGTATVAILFLSGALTLNDNGTLIRLGLAGGLAALALTDIGALLRRGARAASR
jgi:hypothetical protein